MLDQISIVMANTSHPGNIGGAARAMKNMGLSKLVLANPAVFPHADATARASGADELLAHAKVCKDLPEAVAGAQLVLATTGRSHSMAWPSLTPRQAVELIRSKPGVPVAIVFGNERNGLSKDELGLAQYHITIPTVDDFGSLNLAAAVQVIAYELFTSQNSPVLSSDEGLRELITAGQMAGMMQHLYDVMTEVEFLNPAQPKLLQKRLQRLFHRASLDVTELNIVRGLLSAVQQKLNNR